MTKKSKHPQDWQNPRTSGSVYTIWVFQVVNKFVTPSQEVVLNQLKNKEDLRFGLTLFHKPSFTEEKQEKLLQNGITWIIYNVILHLSLLCCLGGVVERQTTQEFCSWTEVQRVGWWLTIVCHTRARFLWREAPKVRDNNGTRGKKESREVRGRKKIKQEFLYHRLAFSFSVA